MFHVTPYCHVLMIVNHDQYSTEYYYIHQLVFIIAIATNMDLDCGILTVNGCILIIFRYISYKNG